MDLLPWRLMAAVWQQAATGTDCGALAAVNNRRTTRQLVQIITVSLMALPTM